MTLFVGIAAVASGLALPAAIPQVRLAPALGIALSLALIALRATLGLTAALSVLILVPGWGGFDTATNWCLHAVIPYVSAHLGINGHRLGETATVVPLLGLALSLGVAVVALGKAGRALSSWVSTSGLGAGPGGSVVIGGDEVVVLAAGMRRPKILVSAGALAAFDDEELGASLAHEWAHIERRHSYIAVLAALLYPLGRVLPGGRRTLANLHFHLERDADELAVDRRENPLALAAAICKAGRSVIGPSPLLAGLGGHAVPVRVRLLLDRASARPTREAMMLAGAALVIAVSSLVLFLGLDAEMGKQGINALVRSGAIPFCPT